MEIRIVQYLFGIITSVFLINASTAATCPAGLFCTSGGNYVPANGGIQSYQMVPADLVTPNWGMWSEEGLCAKCSNSTNTCWYCGEDYDEIWVSTWFGFYLVKNGEVTYHSAGNTPAPGVFPCPGTHPSSAKGASSVFECYTVIGNGQKEYYKAPTNTQNGSSGSGTYNNDKIKLLVKDLLSSLNQANKVAQDIQKELNKQNLPNATNSTNTATNNRQSSGASKTDINTMKAMIKSGISNKK